MAIESVTDETRCETCLFWSRFGVGGDSGKCRRYPPTSVGTDKTKHAWAITYEADWCGEWKEASK